ncbi:GNAT family N-acetyltransferase [Rhodococcus spongiicola]|uniref:MarR family transcriptional regulator n=1 Tax=Rhodococcus spongiicola TaxID=2487352 RepID=A0A3S3CUU0_9NOCA|nr:GNAT family N-acetyltransferase [Rhodococcus spongiicola]RVW06141.1 MarR family transcriptional regulator [Rhodococcus spongiicola]
MAPLDPLVSEVREFNRFYTRAVGLEPVAPAGAPFSPTEASVLDELTRFADAGLVDSEAPVTERLGQRVVLTQAGRDSLAKLDTARDRAADALLSSLGRTQRRELVEAMARIRRALGKQARSPDFVLRAPDPGDLGWVIERHGSIYASEYQWDATLEVTVTKIVADFAERRGSREAAWIAELDGERIGCVFCIATDQVATAQLRLLFVDPSARNMGVGTRLVQESLRFAKQSEYNRIMLWTIEVLEAARRIYAKSGFQIDRREPEHHFGQDLVSEYWSRAL